MGKIKLEKLDKEIPFFKDSILKDYVLPEPIEKQKEWTDRTCEWLFHNGPMLEENRRFIALMRVLHGKQRI